MSHCVYFTLMRHQVYRAEPENNFSVFNMIMIDSSTCSLVIKLTDDIKINVIYKSIKTTTESEFFSGGFEYQY